MLSQPPVCVPSLMLPYDFNSVLSLGHTQALKNIWFLYFCYEEWFTCSFSHPKYSHLHRRSDTQKMSYDCIRGKKKFKNYLFPPEFPGPCSSPEEKMMSSSLVEQHWLRRYWALLAGSGMGFEHNSLHPSKHHFSGTGASACLGNHVRGRNQLSFTFW